MVMKQLLQIIHENNNAVHRANTRIAKSFIRSLSKLGKSDAIDAQGLARYAKERHNELKLYTPVLDIDKELAELTNHKTELKRMAAQQKNRLQVPDNKYCKISNITVMLHNHCNKNNLFISQFLALKLIKSTKLLTKYNGQLRICPSNFKFIGEIRIANFG